MSDKSLILLKQNPLIKAKYVTKDGTSFKAVHHDLINALMHAIQKTIKLSNTEFDTVSIRSQSLRKLARLSLTNDDFIYKSLVDLTNIGFDLDKVSRERLSKQIGGNVKAGYITFITSIIKVVDEKDKRNFLFKISFNKNFFSIVLNIDFSVLHGNYTPISVTIASGIDTKYGKKLYELLTMKQKMGNFTLKIEELRIYFGNKQHISQISQTIKRASNQVNEFIPFSIEVHKLDKAISFYYKK